MNVGGPELFLFGIAWVVPLVFVYLMVRRPSDRSVAAFAKAYSVPLTSQNVDQLRRYIQWTRRWRLGATVVVTVLVGAVDALAERRAPAWWWPLVVGYSVGSLAGEWLRPVDRAPDTSAASLSRRRLGDYVTPAFLGAVAVVLVTSLVPAVYLLVTDPQRSWIERVGPAGFRPQTWFVVGLGAVAILMALIGWFGGRALAQASAPADSPDRQAVRHAIRSAAIMSVIGGTTMIIGVVGAKLGSAAVSIESFGRGSSGVEVALMLCTWTCALGAVWGAILTMVTVPRFAPFAGPLPAVPFSEPRGEA